MMSEEKLRQAIMADPDNQEFTDKGWVPIITIPPTAKIAVIGQAPGIKAQEAQQSFRDKSGDKLRTWMNVSEEEYYDSGLIATIPMDFYYPGKAKSGDLPPRKDFADKWHPLVLETMPDLELILLVGAYAQKYYLGKEMKKI